LIDVCMCVFDFSFSRATNKITPITSKPHVSISSGRPCVDNIQLKIQGRTLTITIPIRFDNKLLITRSALVITLHIMTHTISKRKLPDEF